MLNITTLMELDVQKGNQRDVIDSGMFAVKNRCPAIVTVPELIAPMLADKSMRNGQYVVIAAIDMPGGKLFALDKWRDIGTDVLAADGFEVMLSKNRTPAEYRNEIRTITEFIRGQVNPLAELRFVLQVNDRSDVELTEIAKGLASFPPTYVRTDYRLSIPGGSLDHKGIVERIRKHVAVSVKVSGNIDYETILELKNVPGIKRFAVSVAQATEALKASRAVEETGAKAVIAKEVKIEDKKEIKQAGVVRDNALGKLEQGPLGKSIKV